MEFTRLVDKYTWTTTTLNDPRTDDWFMMTSIWPTIICVCVYLGVIYGGTKFMSNQPAMGLKNILVLYNSVMVLVSLYLFVEFVLAAWVQPGFSLVCQPVDYSLDPTSLRLAHVCYWFYCSKLIELLDTVFFVLRKKNQQITFLHVYHHSTMPILWWAGVKFVPGGESYFSATINCWIHVLMYLYYFLSSMGPAMRKYLWWKNYMTKMQLLQFWAILFHTSYAIYKDCGYPLGYNISLILYMISHIILFSNFYYHTYVNKKGKSAEKCVTNGVANGVVTANGSIRRRIE